MIFNLEGLTVYFPYEYIYPEQYKYMLELKHGLDARGHGCLEMHRHRQDHHLPRAHHLLPARAPGCGKLIYCTRTVPEMEKVLAELRVLQAYREKHVGKAAEIMALGLSSRKNMLHPPSRRGRGQPRERRRAMPPTHSHVGPRATHGGCGAGGNPGDGSVPVLRGLREGGPRRGVTPGVYTLADLRDFGRKKGWCPYFLARHMIAYANVVVYNYQYLLDPKVSSLVSRELEKECVVVFDEAHNIDNVCIEALSVESPAADPGRRRQKHRSLSNKIERAKQTDARRLREEYERLVNGLAQQG